MIDIVFSNVGGPSAGLGAAAFGSENRSEIVVKMKKDKQKEIPTVEYMNLIRSKIENEHPGVEVKALNMGLVDSEQAPIEIFISSNDDALMFKEARRLKNAIKAMHGAKDPYLSTEDVTPEVKIALNREKMGQLGVNVGTVGMQLQGSLSGNDDSQIDLDGSEYDIRVMLDASNRKDVEDIQGMTFPNNEGKQVRLSEFADISVDNAAGTLERKNRMCWVQLPEQWLLISKHTLKRIRSIRTCVLPGVEKLSAKKNLSVP
jgi:HAE1 family hydrophobic/amphiphilic exporter-1